MGNYSYLPSVEDNKAQRPSSRVESSKSLILTAATKRFLIKSRPTVPTQLTILVSVSGNKNAKSGPFKRFK